MGNVDAFLKSLVNFDKDNTPENCVTVVEKEYISQPGFSPDNIRSKSSAAAGLCGWVINICKYFRIYQVVAPKRAALAEANRKLEGANKKLAGIRARVKELQDKVAALEEGLMKATADKNAAIAQAEKTGRKAQLADRLINGLSGENTRWNQEIKRMESVEGRLVGDVMVAAAFVSYAGPFNMHFRQQLVNEKWLPDLIERAIPMSQGIKPLDMLTNDATKARWANEGLPTDPLSIENGAIMTNASRWSLMVDPQLQGIKWIMNREEPNGLVIIQQSQHKYIDKVSGSGWARERYRKRACCMQYTRLHALRYLQPACRAQLGQGIHAVERCARPLHGTMHACGRAWCHAPMPCCMCTHAYTTWLLLCVRVSATLR